jgi:hypothetical protein
VVAGVVDVKRGRFRRRAGVALATAALGLLPVVASPSAAPAGAAPEAAEGGYWYVTRMSVDEFHAQGFTGAGVTVAVIDMLINADLPDFADADLVVPDESPCADKDDPSRLLPASSTDVGSAGHGSSMSGLIVGGGVEGGMRGVAPDARVLYYPTGYQTVAADAHLGALLECPALGSGEDQGSGLLIAAAINDAVAQGADIISSSTSNTSSPPELASAVANAVAHGVVIVQARPNDASLTTPSALWGMNGIVTVQAADPDGNLQESSSVADPGTDVIAPGVDILTVGDEFGQYAPTDGTSNATAITAGTLAVVKSAYPEATGNQLIQSLIHNTGVDDHELERDPGNYSGYGAISLRHMLREDPAQYEDVNPLVSADRRATPTVAEIAAAGGAAPVPSATPSSTEESPGSAAGAGDDAESAPGVSVAPIALIVAGVVVLLAIVAAILIFIAVRSRRRGRTEGAP